MWLFLALPAIAAAAPTISSLTPTSGAVGASVTIAGSGFGSTQGTSTVKFNGTTATITTWGTSSIVATVPVGATTGNVVVTVAGVASSGKSFTVLATPAITSLTPTSAAVGASVTIAGANFGTTQGTSTVKFNGTTATVTTWSAASIVVAVPVGATTGNVIVHASGVNSNGTSFSVVAAPSITTLTPTSGPVGTSVTIAGANFGATQGTSTVKFNGTAATVTTWSAGSIVAPVPAGATTGNVVVHASGVPSNGVTFTVPAPSVTSLNQVSGPVGQAVTITGTNFGTTQGSSAVRFNGVAATTTSWGNTSIAVTVPAAATTGPVVVTVGGVSSNGVTFTVKPNITSLTPTSAAVGQPVTISGTTFGATQGASTVSFNGTIATAATWSSTSIGVTVPAGATTGAVIVTTAGGASNGVTFTVLPTPSITSLNPLVGPVGQAVTIAGTNFGASQGSSTVTFNGTPATPTTWNNTGITVTVPPGATTGPVVVTVNAVPSNGVTFTMGPTVTAVTPTTGGVGQAVTLSGTDFGATQGSSTVTFNGAAATVTSWANASIGVTVPVSATTGPVVVTVGGVQSNSVAFTLVTTGTIAGVITRVTGGSSISGASVQAVLAGVTKGTTTSAADGSYVLPNLDPGTYDVRVSAAGFSNEVRSGTNVSVGGTTTVSVSMLQPGTLTGRVTQADGITPIAGAAVTLYSGPTPKGSATTNGAGDYSFTGVRPGAFSVQAADVGYRTKQQGVTVPENATATANLSLDPAATGPVSYVYDEIGRLVSVVDPSGDAAHYTYDKVGNLLSIARVGATTVSISEFTPNSGPIGTTVTIYGTGFSPTPGSNTVTFGGTLATVTAATANQLTVTAPAGGQIAVSAPNGAADTGLVLFVVSSTDALPTITSFSPTIWDGTSALTIIGTNFDAVPANDRVNLNVAFATPATATATNLSVPVPPTATSGHVAVATMAGTALSASDFFIPPPSYLAANLQTTGRITIGANQTVSIPTSGRFAMLLFDGIPGHRVSANFTDVTLGSGTGAIYDPYGLGRSTGLDVFNARFIEPIAMPSNGTYSLLVASTGGSTGSATVTLYDVADVSGAIVAGGSAQTVTMDTPGQNAVLTFTESAGHRISLNMASAIGGFGTCTVVTIAGPDGNPLVSNPCVTSQGGFIDVQPPLTATGTYKVIIDPPASVTGSMTLTLYDVPPDVSDTIVVDGDSRAFPMNTPGQNASVTFSGTQGQRVSLNMASSIGWLGTCTAVTVKKPDGTTLVANTCVNTQGAFIDVQTLPSTGTYTIVIDPPGNATGSMTLTLYDVPVDFSATIVVGGTAQTVPTGKPGQNASLTFTGANLQRVSFNLTDVTIGGLGTCTSVMIKNPNGSPLVSNNCVTTQGAFIEPQTLGASGTYTIAIDPEGSATGSMTLTLYDVVDRTGSLTINDAALPVNISVPGQNANYTVNGTIGQSLRIPVTTPGATTCATVTLLRQDNVTSVASIFSCGSLITLPSTTLPATETYHVVVDPYATVTGSYSISVVSP